MIALDHGDRAAGPQQPLENRQGLNRPREVLQDETDENVVEGLGVEGQGEDVRLLELHVGESGPVGPSPGLGDRLCGDINRREARIGAPLGQGDRLGADAAPNLEHPAPARVSGVGMQQVDQRTGLILQALVLPQVIAVYIRLAHGSTFVSRRWHVSNRHRRPSVGVRGRRLSEPPRTGKLKPPFGDMPNVHRFICACNYKSRL